MKIQLEGISVIEGPRDLNRIRGRLPLPPGFPENRFAVKWAKQGPGVAMARETEQISGTNYKVNGWEVWYDAQKKPCIRPLSDGAYVLMVRPKVVQQNVAKICGNLSRERMMNEARGRTVAGQAIEDSGMLPDPVLETVFKDRKTGEESNDELESISVNELTKATIPVSSRAKSKTR